MSFNAAALQMMLDKGLCLADVVEIAAANEVRRDPTAAERMARYRERKRDADDATRNVTRNADDAAPCLDKEKSPGPPKEINPIPCVRVARTKLGYHRLPEGWRSTIALPLQLQAKVDQWPPGALDDEVAAFKRWAANAEDKNGKGRKLDWDKALWNWLGRRHDERYSRLPSTIGNITSLRGARPDPALDLLRAASAAEDRENYRGAGTTLPALRSGGP